MFEQVGKWNHRELRDKWNRYWEEIGLNKLQREKAKNGERFFYLDGPPYANAPPHIGHALTRSLRESILKYKQMKGHNIWLQLGFDTHGLPIEVTVQSKLKLKSTKDIEKFGIKNYNEECRKHALTYLNVWKDFYRSYGSSSIWDLNNFYFTFDREYVYSSWIFFKKAYEKGLLYKGKMTVPWCPHCETALSSHEASQEYKDIEDNSIYLRFRIRDNEYFLVWTTTPWTLPGNVAIAVNPRYVYAKVRVGNEYYWLAKDLVEKIIDKLGFKKYEIVEEKKGRELEGMVYDGILNDEVPLQKKIKHRVILADYVTTEEGTGCVHTAPGYGPEDYESGLKYSLPIVCVVDKSGKMTEEAGKYSGLDVFDSNDVIVNDLKESGILLKVEKVRHRYPHCWRCKTKLIYRASPQWFFRTTKIKNKMLEENEKVKWVPEWVGKKRFVEWLSNARDWCISRQRFWGIPLPIWECECGNIEVIGSFEELKEKAINCPNDLDPHRPYVDKVKIRCPKCGREMKRVPDVADVWFDSGAATWASFHNWSEFKKWFPINFITEAIDQTRGWFYTLMIEGVLMFDQAPYQSVLVNGLILDEKGRKMSKSLGNVVDPREVIEEFGADVMRLYLLSSIVPWENTSFSREELTINRNILNIFWNTYSYLVKYFRLYNYNMEKPTDFYPEDKWILSRLHSTLKEMEESYNSLNTNSAARAWKAFVVNDLSKRYIKFIRNRVKNNDNRKGAFWCLYESLKNSTIASATFLPFISEEIYQNISSKKKSIHLEDWPKADENLIDRELEERASMAMKIIEMGLALRKKAGIKIRQPLGKLCVNIKENDVISEFERIIKDQVNVKEVEVVEKVPKGNYESYEEKELSVYLLKDIDDELKREGNTREVIRAVQKLRKELSLVETDKIVCWVEPESFLKEVNADELKKHTNVFSFEKNKGKEIDLKVGETKVKIYVSKM